MAVAVVVYRSVVSLAEVAAEVVYFRSAVSLAEVEYGVVSAVVAEVDAVVVVEVYFGPIVLLVNVLHQAQCNDRIKLERRESDKFWRMWQVA